MLCSRCGLCSRRNRKINIVLGGRVAGGECFQGARKLNFTAKCLNTFEAYCPQQWTCFAKITSVVLNWNVCHRVIPEFGFFSWENYDKLTHQYKNLKKLSLFFGNAILHSSPLYFSPKKEWNNKVVVELQTSGGSSQSSLSWSLIQTTAVQENQRVTTVNHGQPRATTPID